MMVVVMVVMMVVVAVMVVCNDRNDGDADISVLIIRII
jgi:hypothetical protein